MHLCGRKEVCTERGEVRAGHHAARCGAQVVLATWPRAERGIVGGAEGAWRLVEHAELGVGEVSVFGCPTPEKAR